MTHAARALPALPHRRFWPAPLSAAALRSMVDSGRGVVAFFQPIVDTQGVVSSVESLARLAWNGRLVEGAELIPACQTQGLLPALGRHVHRAALMGFGRCRDHALLPDRISLNASALELQLPGFVDGLLEMMQAAAVLPAQVTIEITEDVAVERSEPALASLERLSAAGCKLSIDDFGKGAHGFQTLRAMKVDQLKLDKGFLRDLVPGDAIIGGIVRIANDLGIEVVAEGVETSHQASMLADLGCHLLQGYHFGRPVAAPVPCGPVLRC